MTGLGLWMCSFREWDTQQSKRFWLQGNYKSSSRKFTIHRRQVKAIRSRLMSRRLKARKFKNQNGQSPLTSKVNTCQTHSLNSNRSGKVGDPQFNQDLKCIRTWLMCKNRTKPSVT